MAEKLKDDMAKHWARLKASSGRTVTLQRGGLANGSATAIVGRTPFRLTDGAGMSRLEFAERSYLIMAAEYVIGGAQRTPERGDRIVDPIDNETYAVVPPDNGEPHYRKADQFGLMLRLNCKRV